MQNIIVCIMSSWGNIAGLSISIFFLFCSCDDDIARSGFQRGIGDKFKVAYREVEVPSTVLLLDSLRTDRNPGTTFPRRLIVGRYTDDQFGEVKAQAYTQIRPYTPKITISSDAKFVSAVLVLSFDYYFYGSQDPTDNHFLIHELTDSINYNKVYYSESAIPFNPVPIGEKSYQITPEKFIDMVDKIGDGNVKNRNEIDTLVVPLASQFASRLFEAARDQTSEYTNFVRFRQVFPGLVIVPGSTDSNIVGFNPDNNSSTLSQSRLIVYYDEPDSDGKQVRKTLRYSLYRVNSTSHRGFTQIIFDRNNTPLQDLTRRYTEFNTTGVRYYQSGGPVIVKLDFNKFLEFADTIPNILFNSVELSIEVEQNKVLSPPASLGLRFLYPNNYFINFYDNTLERKNATRYLGNAITYDQENYAVVSSPNKGLLTLDKDTNSYRGDFTAFFQALRDIENEKERFKYVGLVAQTPFIGLSVNRFLFKSENIKLKIFYTTSVVGQTP